MWPIRLRPKFEFNLKLTPNFEHILLWLIFELYLGHHLTSFKRAENHLYIFNLNLNLDLEKLEEKKGLEEESKEERNKK